MPCAAPAWPWALEEWQSQKQQRGPGGAEDDNPRRFGVSQTPGTVAGLSDVAPA